jgi:hypothetical protein
MRPVAKCYSIFTCDSVEGGSSTRSLEELVFMQRFEMDTSRIWPGRFATEWQCTDRFVDITLHLWSRSVNICRDKLFFTIKIFCTLPIERICVFVIDCFSITVLTEGAGRFIKNLAWKCIKQTYWFKELKLRKISMKWIGYITTRYLLNGATVVVEMHVLYNSHWSTLKIPAFLRKSVF